MPTPKKPPTTPELFQLVTDELDRSIHQPNILAYGEKDYPEQLRFHQSTMRGRYIAGGNRGGKTDAEVVEAIWWATNTHPWLTRPVEWGTGPLQIRFVVVDISKGVEQIIIPKLKRWIPKSYLINGSWDKSWDGQNLILTFANGSTIDFVTWGMELMKLGGVPRHIIFFDEEPPQHIFNESMARLLDFNGMWVIAGTPTKGMGWTYDLLWEPAETLIEAGEEPLIGIFTLSAEQNPYIQAEEEDFDFYFMGMDKEEREIREKGHFVARSGLVFPVFSSQTSKFIAEPFMPPREWDWYSSVDQGLHNPTAWLWHAVGPQGQIITFAEHYKAEMLVNQHAQIVLDREKGWKREPDVRVGDPAMRQRNGVTGTSYVQEYAVNGVFIQVDGIPHDVMIGIEKMQQYLMPRDDSPWGPGKPMWMISSNCVNFIREMKKLRWATYSSEKLSYELNKQEVVHKRDDHAFDSARYFATLMPDLTPIPIDPASRTVPVPTTISYQEMLAKMADDPDVSFVDNEAPRDSEPQESDWETSYSYGDLYEGDLVD